MDSQQEDCQLRATIGFNTEEETTATGSLAVDAASPGHGKDTSQADRNHASQTPYSN